MLTLKWYLYYSCPSDNFSDSMQNKEVKYLDPEMSFVSIFCPSLNYFLVSNNINFVTLISLFLIALFTLDIRATCTKHIFSVVFRCTFPARDCKSTVYATNVRDLEKWQLQFIIQILRDAWSISKIVHCRTYYCVVNKCLVYCELYIIFILTTCLYI